MAKRPEPRRYRKVARAEAEEATRRRITEATVELHGSVGPANTSVAEVARRAGVSRMTVYNHFPTEVDLFGACSRHWAGQNPFPDPTGWAAVADPGERLEHALAELYSWYGAKQGMLGKVFRDAPVVPALAEVMGELWAPYAAAMVDTLATGWGVRGTRARELRAALGLAVAFGSWQELSAAGLTDRAAARTMSRMLRASFG